MEFHHVGRGIRLYPRTPDSESTSSWIFYSHFSYRPILFYWIFCVRSRGVLKDIFSLFSQEGNNNTLEVNIGDFQRQLHRGLCYRHHLCENLRSPRRCYSQYTVQLSLTFLRKLQINLVKVSDVVKIGEMGILHWSPWSRVMVYWTRYQGLRGREIRWNRNFTRYFDWKNKHFFWGCIISFLNSPILNLSFIAACRETGADVSGKIWY